MLTNRDCANCIHEYVCGHRKEVLNRNPSTPTEWIADGCFSYSRDIKPLEAITELIDDKAMVYYPSPKEMMDKINEIIEVLYEMRERVY